MAAMLTCVACRKTFASNIANCPNCGLPREASMGAPAQPPAAAAPAMPTPVQPRAFGATPRSRLAAMPGGCAVRLAIVGLVAVVGVIVAIVTWVSNEFPSVHVVNTTGAPISVWVDGKLKKDGIPSTNVEDKGAIRDVRLTKGSHLIEAKDGTGNVLSRQNVQVEHGERMLFAPGHGDQWCFSVVTSEYGTVSYGLGGSDSPLDASQDFWKIDSSVDRWLEDSPETKDVDSSVGFTTDTAVRMMPCGG